METESSLRLKSVKSALGKRDRKSISWERVTSKINERESVIEKAIHQMSKLDNAAYAAAAKYRVS